jgi:hypothetical protein
MISCTPSNAPFARGHCVDVFDESHNIRARGRASLDQDTGRLDFNFQLETDNVLVGPKATMQVLLNDASNSTLVRVEVPEQEIGGKPPGGAIIVDFPGQTSIPVDVAKQVSSINVAVQITGTNFEPFNGVFRVIVPVVETLILAAA